MAEPAGRRASGGGLRARLARGDGTAAAWLRGAIGAGFGQGIGMAATLAAQWVLARTLGVSEFGYYIYAFTWISVLAILARLGFQTSLLRFVASYRANGEWARLRGLIARSVQAVTLASVLIAAVLVGVVALIGAEMADRQQTVFVLGAVLLPALALLGLLQALFKGYRRTTVGNFVYPGALQLALILAWGVVLLAGLRATSVSAMAATIVAASAAAATMGAIFLYTTRGDLRGAAAGYETRLWMRTSLPLLLTAGMQLILRRTDIVMLGMLESTEAAGIYAVVVSLAQAAMFAHMCSNAIVSPMISELYYSERHAQLRQLVRLAAWGVGGATLASAGVLVVLGEWVLGWFGPSFGAGYSALAILVFAHIANALAGPSSTLMAMAGRQDALSIILGLAAVFNIALNAVLIPTYGMVGAAVATVLASVLWNLLSALYIWRSMGLNATAISRPPNVRAALRAG